MPHLSKNRYDVAVDQPTGKGFPDWTNNTPKHNSAEYCIFLQVLHHPPELAYNKRTRRALEPSTSIEWWHKHEEKTEICAFVLAKHFVSPGSQKPYFIRRRRIPHELILKRGL